MNQLLIDETELVGHWEYKQGATIADENCQRIEWLITSQPVFISSDTSGWIRLYQDPNDGRYWKLSYPHSEQQGGGPPTLSVIDKNDAKRVFSFE